MWMSEKTCNNFKIIGVKHELKFSNQMPSLLSQLVYIFISS